MPEFTGQRDIRIYIRTIWRWKFLIAALVVAAPLVAYLLESGKPKQYRASATVSVSQDTVNSSLLSGTTNFSTTNVQAIAALVTTTSVAKLAGSRLQPAESPAEAASGVSASANLETDFITITAIRTDPEAAASVANAFADALNVNQVSSAKTQIDQAIASTRTQLSHLAPSDTDYDSLKSQLTQLQAALHDQSGDVSIIQRATANATPVGPHPKRAIELGLVIGILLAVAAVMLLDSVDRRLRTPDDLEDLTGLPVLASFAPSAFRSELETSPIDEEAFQTLRTSLTYFTVDRPIKSVLVASPGEKEGKSTVAVRLALASARAGLNVILVDADLRRAGATVKLGLEPGIGLGLVLAERRPVETALIEWPMAEHEPGRLRVVAAGSPPPNPAALISSPQMRGLIATLEDRADLVIIDTPAGLAVSDSVPLMQHVSGVVLVARMNRSSRDTVRRLHKIIESAHGHLLGVIATGVTSGPGYEKYSQTYYAPTAADAPAVRQAPPMITLRTDLPDRSASSEPPGTFAFLPAELRDQTPYRQAADQTPYRPAADAKPEPAANGNGAAAGPEPPPRRRPRSLRLKH
jgi:capsular exopolysaccharide synthesis family protein